MHVLAIMGLAVGGLGAPALMAWRRADRRADRREMKRLIDLQPADPPRFSASMVAALPEPVRKYFTFAIAEGTPLFTVAHLDMAGQFGMGDQDEPRYLPMRAEQVLAAPHGFVWAMSAGRGATRLGGSDSATWTRFWLGGLVPVARLGGTRDHTRAAFARYAAEAIFWTPAAVLPGPNVTWTRLADDTARMTMRRGELQQAVDLTIAPEDGRPLRVSMMRWSDANPQKRHRLQPFGGHLSAFREFGGFRLPTHVEASNHFGTDDAFTFFIADVSDVRFPAASGGTA